MEKGMYTSAESALYPRAAGTRLTGGDALLMRWHGRDGPPAGGAGADSAAFRVSTR